MATSSTAFRGPSSIGRMWPFMGWPGPFIYHWTFNRKGNLSLHRGEAEKCKRVHYNQRGDKG